MKMLKVVAPALLATLVAGHGHITNIVINGVSYEGWDINSFPYETDPPTVVAWGTPNTANGFITPGQYRNLVLFSTMITTPLEYSSSVVMLSSPVTHYSKF
jgi:hypothetical protein